MNFVQISPDFAIARNLSDELLTQAAERGMRRVVNLVPLDEISNSTEGALRRSANGLGLAYVHTPVSAHAIFDKTVLDAARKAFDPEHGPVLAACRTGQRAAVVWAALAAEELGVDAVLANLAAAGLDLEFFREDLEVLAVRSRPGMRAA